jgi:signal transduction histidine kinase
VLYRVRVRQLTARERVRLEERMAERVRIARELHDTLLQSTQSLILTVQTAARGMPEGDPVRGNLNLALDRADAVMAEGRDRIQDLRVAADADTDLPALIASVGSVLASGTKTTFNVQVEGAPRELTHAVRSEAYRIGREALLNAFRHAEARAIWVLVVYGEQDFRLRVRDDGKGISPAALEVGANPGHWGLKGMRERAETIGAIIHFWTRPESGTEIELIVRANEAYRPASHRPPWWRAVRPRQQAAERGWRAPQ